MCLILCAIPHTHAHIHSVSNSVARDRASESESDAYHHVGQAKIAICSGGLGQIGGIGKADLGATSQSRPVLDNLVESLVWRDS
jgi:hypothetical protein